MKLLLVLGSDATLHRITSCVKPLGFEIIRYFHALKAMDNVDEIDPQAIIISAVDFPRHWKAMVQFFRNERSKECCPIILLKGENFGPDDTSKASYIGVSGVINEALESPLEIDRLQGILSRYLPVDEKRRNRRYHVDPKQGFNFLFAHPVSYVFVTGQVKDISSGGLSFLPDNSSLTGDVGLNTRLEECSLRSQNTILAPVCRLARTGRVLSMEFLSFPGGEQQVLNVCIEKLLHGELYLP